LGFLMIVFAVIGGIVRLFVVPYFEKRERVSAAAIAARRARREQKPFWRWVRRTAGERYVA
jgi:hypothetical protein